MTIERAIEALRLKYRKPRGVTATKGHRNYEGAKDIDFVPCMCWKAIDDEYFDYIGRSKNGTVYMVGCQNKITVGSNSFHKRYGTRECV
jgi:hypothetical protein